MGATPMYNWIQVPILVKLHTYQEGVKGLIMMRLFGESMASLPNWSKNVLKEQVKGIG